MANSPGYEDKIERHYIARVIITEATHTTDHTGKNTISTGSHDIYTQTIKGEVLDNLVARLSGHLELFRDGIQQGEVN